LRFLFDVDFLSKIILLQRTSNYITFFEKSVKFFKKSRNNTANIGETKPHLFSIPAINGFVLSIGVKYNKWDEIFWSLAVVKSILH